MIVAGVSVNGVAAVERRQDIAFIRSVDACFQVRLAEVESDKIDRIFAFEPVRFVVFFGDADEFVSHLRVFGPVHTDGRGILRHLAVGAVEDEEAVVVVVRELDVIAQRVDGLAAVEEGGVVVIAELAFIVRHVLEILVEIGDPDIPGGGGLDIPVGVRRRPIIGRIDLFKFRFCHIGIAETREDERELRGSHHFCLILVAVLVIKFAGAVVQIVVALNCEDLEVCIFCILRCVFLGKSSHLVLQIAQLVGDIDERDALAVLGKVARREEILRSFARPRVVEYVIDMCVEDGATLDDQLGVAGGGVVEVAVRIVFRIRIIAMLQREVVDVAHLPECQRVLRGHALRFVRRGSQPGAGEREGEEQSDDQQCGRDGCRKTEPVFHNSSLFRTGTAQMQPAPLLSACTKITRNLMIYSHARAFNRQSSPSVGFRQT